MINRTDPKVTLDHDGLLRELKALTSSDITDPQAARLIADKALSWGQRNGWIDVLAQANFVAAKAYFVQLIYKTAIEHLQRAKTLFKDLSDTVQVMECHSELGHIYYCLAEYSMSIDHLRKALSWARDVKAEQPLVMSVRIRLAHALMNVDYWSDAEQELMKADQFEFTDQLLVEYQMAVLRLVFYRGDHRAIREQLRLCQELVESVNAEQQKRLLDYYSARSTIKYGKLKAGEKQLSLIWKQADKADRSVFFLLFETSLDLLQSDYPQKGIQWLSMLLNETLVPTSLKHRVHVALADFFAAHMSHELASEHYQAANQMTREIRDNQVQLQWARFRADEDHQILQKQILQQKQNNQILAESNALLQAVNRIALSVNSAPNLISLAERIRDQLSGWINVHCLTIAELKDDALHFEVVLEDTRSLPKEVIPMSEDRSWSVRSAREGRILYDNDFSVTDEIRVLDSAHVIRSVAFVPLTWENQILGVLSLQSREPQSFDVRSISLLEYIKPVIGIAFANMLNLQNARMLKGELTKQKQELTDAQQVMAQLSEHDEITGLPNQKALSKAFANWCRHGHFQCVMIGVKNQDVLLRQTELSTVKKYIQKVANQLSSLLPANGTLIRNAEDQFLMFMPTIDESSKLQQFAQSLMNAAKFPLEGKNLIVEPEISIAVVQYPEHGDSLDEVLSVLSVASAYAEKDPTSIIIID